MRVLIVDDEPLARRRLVQLLAKQPGIEIVGEAESGRQALELVELLRPDVLLLDIEMPAIDGFAVLKALPQEPRAGDHLRDGLPGSCGESVRAARDRLRRQTCQG